METKFGSSGEGEESGPDWTVRREGRRRRRRRFWRGHWGRREGRAEVWWRGRVEKCRRKSVRKGFGRDMVGGVVCVEVGARGGGEV